MGSGTALRTSARRSRSSFCLSARALRSSASFRRLASISALLLSDIMPNVQAKESKYATLGCSIA